MSPDHAKLWAKVPGARVEMIAGSGHSPMVEAPAKTLALIRGFRAPVPATEQGGKRSPLTPTLSRRERE